MFPNEKGRSSTGKNRVYYHNGELYFNNGSTWYTSHSGCSGTQAENDAYVSFRNWAKNNKPTKAEDVLKKYQYETGGLADFTGPAWLDGTKSRPEYVLNAEQTERFFALVDVLGDMDKQGSAATNQEVTIDVDINVDKIDSDYDVEQLANKIKSIIYEDSMYRNVNNVSLLR
jgi:hypothetical protein